MQSDLPSILAVLFMDHPFHGLRIVKPTSLAHWPAILNCIVTATNKASVTEFSGASKVLTTQWISAPLVNIGENF